MSSGRPRRLPGTTAAATASALAASRSLNLPQRFLAREGERVLVRHGGSKRSSRQSQAGLTHGTVVYLGSLRGFAGGLWVGVRLDTADGSSDGGPSTRDDPGGGALVASVRPSRVRSAQRRPRGNGARVTHQVTGGSTRRRTAGAGRSRAAGSGSGSPSSTFGESSLVDDPSVHFFRPSAIERLPQRRAPLATNAGVLASADAVPHPRGDRVVASPVLARHTYNLRQGADDSAMPVENTAANTAAGDPTERTRLRSEAAVAAESALEEPVEGSTRPIPGSVSDDADDLDGTLVRIQARPAVNAIILRFIARFRVRRAVRAAARERQRVMLERAMRRDLEEHSATMIQATWRGYAVRKESPLASRSAGLRASAGPADDSEEGRFPSSLPFLPDRMGAAGLTFVVNTCDFETMVELITNPYHVDADLRNIVLLTHPLYATSPKLLHYLFLRFSCRPDTDDEDEVAAFKVNIRPLIHRAVVNVLAVWMDLYFFHFAESEEMQRKVTKFMRRQRESRKVGEEVKDRLMELTILYDHKMETHEASYTMDLSAFGRLQGSIPRPIIPTVASIQFVYQIHPLECARQLALLDLAAFRGIRPRELLHQAWAKKKAAVRAGHVLQFINRFNYTSSWAATEILKLKRLENRVHTVCHLIDVAVCCEALHNYNALAAIVGAIQSTPVDRLKNTMMLVPEDYKEKLETVADLMSFEHNYRNYRTAVKKAVPPVVPHLGCFLKDLTFIDDGNDDYSDEEGRLINFRKHRMTTETVETLMNFRTGTEYCLQPVATISKYLLEDAEVWDDDELYRISLEREERGMKMKRVKPLRHVGEDIDHGKPSFMDDISPRFIKQVVRVLEAQTFREGEYVVRAGDPGREMYFIASGVLEVIIPNRTAMQMTQGEFFGEISLVFSSKRTASVRARTACTLYVLTKHKFDEVVVEYPGVKAQFEALAEARRNNDSKVKSGTGWMRSIASLISD